MEIRKVRERSDGYKYVSIPADSDIEPGDHVRIEKVDDNGDDQR